MCSIQKPKQCPGHTCKSCGTSYQHIAADCFHTVLDAEGESAHKGICEQCVVECQRKELVASALKSEAPLTGKEEVEIRTIAEATVWLMCQKEDWQETVSAHILNLEKVIHKLRIQMLTARDVKGKKQMEEMSKLSPEEIEQFKLEQSGRAKKKKQETDAVRHSKTEKLIASFIKAGIPEAKARKMVMED